MRISIFIYLTLLLESKLILFMILMFKNISFLLHGLHKESNEGNYLLFQDDQ